MIAPSTNSKELSIASPPQPPPPPSPDFNVNPFKRSSSDTCSVTTINSEDTDTCSEKGLHNSSSENLTRSRKFGGNGIRAIIMNPAVLAIISHFPNKCIPKKSEKYVVNGMSVPPPVSSSTSSSLSSPPTHSSISSDLKNNNSSLPLPKSPKKNNSRQSSKFKRYAGLLLAILSSMMFSFTGLIVKVINHHHPLTQATWMFVGTVVCAIPLNLLKYVYDSYKNSRDDDDGENECHVKSDKFKPFPDIIEPITIIAGEEGDLKKLPVSSQQDGNLTSLVISEKLHAPMPSAVINLNAPPVNKAALRKEAERRRKLKTFILLLIRACSGCSGMILYFYSLKYLNVGDSLVIVCSSPIFVFIIGYLFLGESCGVIPVITILLSMAGVSVITRPPMLTGKESFETDDMIGAGLAFSSMLCIAMTIILMRFLQNVYHGLINLVFGIWGTLQTTSLALAAGVLECPRDLQDAILMSATGVLFFLGQTFLAVALQFEEAGPVSLVRTSEVVFAFVWQFIFLQVAPDWFSISGAGLILAGIFLTISRKWIAALPESSPSRKMFSFLLR